MSAPAAAAAAAAAAAPPPPTATPAVVADVVDATRPGPANGELVVVTLNTWGLLGLSKHREARVAALCDWLADPLRHQRPPSPPSSSAPDAPPLLPFAADFWRRRPVDVVLLQEVWVAADAAQLAAAARRGGLAHSVHFRSGAFGAGLVTLSRFPVDGARLRVFAARGDPCAVFSGDFFAAKGVGWCRLAVPGGGDGAAPPKHVHVFNTHLCSNYRHTFRPLPRLPRAEEMLKAAAAGKAAERADDDDCGVRVPTDADAATRVAQVLELCDFVREVSGLGGGGGDADASSPASVPTPLVVLGGDLNSEPDALEVALLRARLPQLGDAWAATAGWRRDAGGGGGDGGPGAPEVEGYTCRSPLCTYAPRRQVPERIDYVWSTLAARGAALDLARVPNGGGGGGGHSFSDHLAVRAALALVERPAADGAAAAPAPPLDSRPASAVASLLLRRVRSAGKDEASAAAAAADGAAAPARGPGGDDVSRAALVGAAVVLAEGADDFAGLASGNTLLGGVLLISTLYTALALPLLLPDTARWIVLSSPLAAAAAALALALGGCGGFALFAAGFLGARSQQNALVMALRSHVLLMRRLGLVPEQPPPTAPTARRAAE
jgi:sphingomyelin phosphodiesterase 2